MTIRGSLWSLAIALAAVLSLSSRGQAQTIASYEVQFYQPGVDATTGAPFTTLTIPASSVTCNQAKSALPSTPIINPKKISWDDPANPTTRDCVVDASTFLMALPVVSGSYTATMTATDSVPLTSTRSAPSNPFGRSAPPAARTGLKVS